LAIFFIAKQFHKLAERQFEVGLYEGKKPLLTCSNFTPDLLGTNYIYYVKLKASKELKPWEEFDSKLRDLYVEFVRLAALQIPISLDLSLYQADFRLFGIDLPQSKKDFAAPFLELCRLVNLYVEKQDDDSYRVIFPEIVLEEMDIDHPRLPLWKNFYRVASTIPSSGAICESIAVRCLLLRLGETILDLQAQLCYKDLFPFLATTCCANYPVAFLSSGNPIERCPKFVYTNPIPTAKQEENRQKKKATESKRKMSCVQKLNKRLAHFFDFTESNGVNVNVMDWQYVHAFLKIGHLYIPGINFAYNL
jgi:hypothetical protein